LHHTHKNLDDLGTRYNVKPDMLALGSRYQVGMDWMNQEEETWPVKKNPGNSAKEIEGELTSAAKKVLTVNSTEIELNLINNLKKYCSYMRAQRVTATFFMAVERFRLKQRNRDNENNGLEPLKKEDLIIGKYLEKAENYLLFHAQRDIRASYKKNRSELFTSDSQESK